MMHRFKLTSLKTELSSDEDRIKFPISTKAKIATLGDD